VSVWQDVVRASRDVVVHSPRPVDEARAILAELLAGRGSPPRPRRPSGVAFVDGAVDGSRVTFAATPRPASPSPSGQEPPRLVFTGTIRDTGDGSVLTGTIVAPMTLGLPAVAITAGVALFLLWGGIPIALVAVGVIAWIFLTIIVVVSLGEQRLGPADEVRRLLEDALA
jgi:hypothetical protein